MVAILRATVSGEPTKRAPSSTSWRKRSYFSRSLVVLPRLWDQGSKARERASSSVGGDDAWGEEAEWVVGLAESGVGHAVEVGEWFLFEGVAAVDLEHDWDAVADGLEDGVGAAADFDPGGLDVAVGGDAAPFVEVGVEFWVGFGDVSVVADDEAIAVQD